jgi:urease accessory protein
MIGKGFLKTSLVDGRTAITRAQATNPLKLLCPRGREAAWVYATTYGGGLVAGDVIDLDVKIADDTSCVLTTQASTKVYKSPYGKMAQQLTQGTVGNGALLVIAPDPISCFADARYQQEQRLDVATEGNLVLVDWLTSGRRARGECWKFAHYSSRIEISLGDHCIFLDSIRLDPADGPLISPFRLGRFHCMALLVIVGPLYEQQRAAILEEISKLPIDPGSSLIQAASEIPHGMVLRIMGTDTEQVGRLLQRRLAFLSERLGGEPWSRKW